MIVNIFSYFPILRLNPNHKVIISMSDVCISTIGNTISLRILDDGCMMMVAIAQLNGKLSFCIQYDSETINGLVSTRLI